MNSGLAGLGECGEASMHHCVGGGPLAIHTPLHSFDSHPAHSSHSSHTRLTEPEESLSSHPDLQSPSLSSQDNDGGPLPPAPLPPHFNDPSDQAQFEADKRQIYK